jgi:hypothetical protein
MRYSVMIWFDMNIQERCAFGLLCVCVWGWRGAYISVWCLCIHVHMLEREGGSVSMFFDRSWTFLLRNILIYRNMDVLQIDPLKLLTVS